MPFYSERLHNEEQLPEKGFYIGLVLTSHEMHHGHLDQQLYKLLQNEFSQSKGLQAMSWNGRMLGRDFNYSVRKGEILSYLQGNYFLLKENNPKTALNYYNPGSSSTPDNFYFHSNLVYNNRGNAYLQLQQFSEAISDFDKAISNVAEYDLPYYNRGCAFAQRNERGDLNSAMQDFEKFLQLHGPDVDAYNNLGVTQLKLRNIAESIKTFSKAIELDPEYSLAYLNRAQAHQNYYQLEQAIQDFNKAIELAPFDSRSYYSRGLLYQEEKKYVDAIHDIRIAKHLNPAGMNLYDPLLNALKRECEHSGMVIPVLESTVYPKTEREQLKEIVAQIDQLKQQLTTLTTADASYEALTERMTQCEARLDLLAGDTNNGGTRSIREDQSSIDSTQSESFRTSIPNTAEEPGFLEASTHRFRKVEAYIEAGRFEAALEVTKDILIDYYENERAQQKLEYIFNLLNYNQRQRKQVKHEILIRHLEIDYLTPYVYASMSQQAYQEAPTPPHGWELLSTETIQSTGYFGVAFVNFLQQTIVIAHRGTEFEKMNDLYTDLKFFLSESIPEQVDNALAFSRSVMLSYPGYRIEQTGHSLGGVLAEVCAWFSNKPAVTFESPGSRNLIQRIRSQRQGQNDNIDLQDCQITTYLASPNPLNTVAPHVGTVRRLFFKIPQHPVEPPGYLQNMATWFGSWWFLPEELATEVQQNQEILDRVIRAMAYYTRQQHAIENMLALFDPHTGQLKSTAKPAQSIIDWPKGIDNFARYYRLILEHEEEFVSHHYDPTFVETLMPADQANLRDPHIIGYETAPYDPQRLLLTDLGSEAVTYLNTFQTTDENPLGLSLHVLNHMAIQDNAIQLTGELNADECQLYFAQYFDLRDISTPHPPESWSTLFNFGAAQGEIITPYNDAYKDIRSLEKTASMVQTSDATKPMIPLSWLSSIMPFFSLLVRRLSLLEEAMRSSEMVTVEQPTSADRDNRIVDSGHWDTEIQRDATTGAPLFTYRVFEDTQEVGSATFYQHPLLCRSEDGTRHNVIARDGVFSDLDLESSAALEHIEETCAALPSTFSEQIAATSVQAGLHGMLRGSLNVLTSAMALQGFSQKQQFWSQNALYYGAFFLVYCVQHFATQSILDSAITPFYQATVGVGLLFLWSTLLHCFSRGCLMASSALQNRSWERTAQGFHLLSQSLGYGVYAWDAYARGPVLAGIRIASGIASEKTVTTLGHAMVHRLFGGSTAPENQDSKDDNAIHLSFNKKMQ